MITGKVPELHLVPDATKNHPDVVELSGENARQLAHLRQRPITEVEESALAWPPAWGQKDARAGPTGIPSARVAAPAALC